MAIYYIESEKGTFLSEDGKRKFMRLCGREAYDYLRSVEGKNKRFMRTSAHEDGGEDEYVEVPSAYIRKHRQDERRVQYVSDCIEGSGIVTVSLYAMADKETLDLVNGEECIADESADVEENAFRSMELETLRKALKALTEEERRLVSALFYCGRQITEAEYAKANGISQQAVSKKKRTVLQKLKKFF
jgi:RNA polymerase sigma factor (sigma-70 family)